MNSNINNIINHLQYIGYRLKTFHGSLIGIHDALAMHEASPMDFLIFIPLTSKYGIMLSEPNIGLLGDRFKFGKRFTIFEKSIRLHCYLCKYKLHSDMHISLIEMSKNLFISVNLLINNRRGYFSLVIIEKTGKHFKW